MWKNSSFSANSNSKKNFFISGMNITNDKYKSATAILRISDSEHNFTDTEHSFTTSVDKMSGFDSFEIMGKNTIKLIKKLARETGNISNEELNEKASKKQLVEEGNEFYHRSTMHGLFQ